MLPINAHYEKKIKKTILLRMKRKNTIPAYQEVSIKIVIGYL